MADDFFLQVGIKTQDIIGGMSGGIVNAFVFRQSNPVAVVGSVVVGCLTAAYLSETAAKYLGTTGGATSFLVGLCAMAICQAIIAAVAKWKPGSNGSSNG